jgi:hypothetical protein
MHRVVSEKLGVDGDQRKTPTQGKLFGGRVSRRVDLAANRSKMRPRSCRSGSLAMFDAMRRASSGVNHVAAQVLSHYLGRTERANNSRSFRDKLRTRFSHG